MCRSLRENLFLFYSVRCFVEFRHSGTRKFRSRNGFTLFPFTFGFLRLLSRSFASSDVSRAFSSSSEAWKARSREGEAETGPDRSDRIHREISKFGNELLKFHDLTARGQPTTCNCDSNEPDYADVLRVPRISSISFSCNPYVDKNTRDTVSVSGIPSDRDRSFITGNVFSMFRRSSCSLRILIIGYCPIRDYACLIPVSYKYRIFMQTAKICQFRTMCDSLFFRGILFWEQ